MTRKGKPMKISESHDVWFRVFVGNVCNDGEGRHEVANFSELAQITTMIPLKTIGSFFRKELHSQLDEVINKINSSMVKE